MSMIPPNRPSSLDPGFQITRETDIGKFEPSLAMVATFPPRLAQTFRDFYPPPQSAEIASDC